jgi:prepilin-type N-terminal cleavage/methylation domain-containing protein
MAGETKIQFKNTFLPKSELSLLSKEGFTLIELLVVISIIGLLASVVLVSLNSARLKSRDAKRVADLNQMSKAFELFFNDKSSYPTTNSAINGSTWGTMSAPASGVCGAVAGCINYVVPNYVTRIPTAPNPPDGNCTATNNEFRFLGTGSATLTATYYITFCLGSQVGALGPGPHTLTQGGFQ